MTNEVQNIALLAPVPYEHLVSGLTVCQHEGKVAYGSRAWMVFRQLDDLRDGNPINVYIYVSYNPEGRILRATWTARYISHCTSNDGAHPEGMRYRPQSTEQYEADNRGHWAVFWEVEQLRELPPDDQIPTGEFWGLSRSGPYGRNFVPEGPILVHQP